jgi:hypothetical protein
VEVVRNQDTTSERVQVLGLHLQPERHGQCASERGSEESDQVVGCVWGIGERKWRGEFGRRMMLFESW